MLSITKALMAIKANFSCRNTWGLFSLGVSCFITVRRLTAYLDQAKLTKAFVKLLPGGGVLRGHLCGENVYKCRDFEKHHNLQRISAYRSAFWSFRHRSCPCWTFQSSGCSWRSVHHKAPINDRQTPSTSQAAEQGKVYLESSSNLTNYILHRHRHIVKGHLTSWK